MTPKDRLDMTMDAYHKIFASKALGSDITRVTVKADDKLFAGRMFKNGVTGLQTLRGFDVSFKGKAGVVAIRLIEQNPDKPSESGRRAKAGSKIMWGIDRASNKFLFSVENGNLQMARERAVSPVGTYSPPPTNIPDASSLPVPEIVLDDLDQMDEHIPDEVLRYYASQEAPPDEEW